MLENKTKNIFEIVTASQINVDSVVRQHVDKNTACLTELLKSFAILVLPKVL